MKSFFRVLLLIVSGLTLEACTNSGDTDQPDMSNDLESVGLTPASRSAAAQLENFYVDFSKDAFKLIDEDMSEETTRANVVVSPISATFALGMLANGSEGDTEAKLIEYLGVDDIYGLNELDNILLSQLPAIDNNTQLHFSNALWAREGYTTNNQFISNIQKYFNASVQHLDFGNPENAQKDINNWILSATDHRISGFFTDLSPYTYFVIASTVYFKSGWAGEYFNKTETTDENFYGLNDGISDNEHVSKVKMMHSRTIEVPYSRDQYFEYISLPFGNGAYSINFILPKEDLKYDNAMEALDKTTYDNLVANAKNRNVKVNVPRLDIDGSVDICNILYSRSIDLSNLELHIFEDINQGDMLSVRQKANFTMNEEGATASAATVEHRYATAAAIDDIYTIDLNRPFLFFITEKSTNACLLAGRVMGF